MPRFYRVKGAGKHHIGEHTNSLSYGEQGSPVFCEKVEIQTNRDGSVDLGKRTFVFQGLASNREWCEDCRDTFREKYRDFAFHDVEEETRLMFYSLHREEILGILSSLDESLLFNLAVDILGDRILGGKKEG